MLGSFAVVAGSMLGVGIFLTPRLVALQVDSTAMFLALWALGGIVALAGAVAYGELGAMFPRAGGDYVYLRHAYGPSVGVAGGWLLFVGVFAGSIASMSVALCRYQLPVLLSGLGAVDPSVSLWLGLDAARIGAIALVIALTTLNCLRLRVSLLVQALSTLLPFAVLVVVAIYALADARPTASTMPAGEAVATPFGVATAFLAVYFSYAGWNALAYVGGEVERPGRTIPLGLISGTAAVTALYLLLCAAFLHVLGLEGLRGSVEAGSTVAQALFGRNARIGVAALIALALLGSLNATVLQGSRIGYAMADSAGLPSVLARLGARTRAPVTALWVQAACACLLIASGTFETLVELTGIAMLAMGGLSVIALFLLRRREPDRARAYRAMGYPWLPGIYVVACLVVIALQTLRAGRGALVDDGGIGAWLPLFGLILFAAIAAAHALHARLRG